MMTLIEIDGLPNLIAWWIFPWQTVSYNQMVYGEHPMVFLSLTDKAIPPAAEILPRHCPVQLEIPSNLGPGFFGQNLSHRTIPVTLILLLVGGLEHEFYFSIYWECQTPIDELIFFRGVAQPTTSSHFNGIISNVMNNCL